MSITSDWATLMGEHDQRNDAIEFRVVCQRFYNDLVTYTGELQVIIDKGNFDTVPSSIRTELVQFRTLLIALRSNIDGDAGIVEALGI